MNRITKAFQQGKVFAAYITAGDGTLDHQMNMIRALIVGGVNLLEIGVPFSDPIADGPVIQRAMQRALNGGTSMQDVMQLIQAIRAESDVPIVLFTYYNPILATPGILKLAKSAGVDGVLIVDLPFFHGEGFLNECAFLDLAPIAVVSPTTNSDRLQMILQQAKGFIYYACQKGTTGVRQGLPQDVPEKIAAIKQITPIPVIVGFGIADRQAAQAACDVADGFVVGSYFIQAIESGINPEELKAMASQFYPRNVA